MTTEPFVSELRFLSTLLARFLGAQDGQVASSAEYCFGEGEVGSLRLRKSVAANGCRADAQQIARVWQDHIKLRNLATSTADTWMKRNGLSSLKWQVPFAATEYDIDSDDNWTSEEEGRRSLYALQREHHQFSANGRCPECCRRTSRA